LTKSTEKVGWPVPKYCGRTSGQLQTAGFDNSGCHRCAPTGGAELLTIERSGTSSAVRPRAARPLGRVLLSQRPVQRRELGRLREQFLGIGFEPTGTTPQGRPTSRRKTARDGRLSSRPWASRSTRDPETVRIQLPVQVCKSVTQWIRSDQRVHKRAGYRRPFGSRRDAARECSSGRSASRMS
jgi:hypothetical protein